jgi:hypothetical protein
LTVKASFDAPLGFNFGKPKGLDSEKPITKLILQSPKAYWFSGVGNGFASFLSAFQRTFFRISLKFISRRRVLSKYKKRSVF